MNDESQIETVLKNLPPEISPRLGQRLASAPWTPRAIRRRRTFTAISLTVVLLIAFLSLTSQGRAFAQTIIKFFTPTDQSSIPLSKEDIETFYSPPPVRTLSLVSVTPSPVTTSSCSNPEDAGTYQCEIQSLEQQLNVDIKEFSTTPLGWTFAEVQFYSEIPPSVLATNPAAWSTTASIVDISYRSTDGAIYLKQGIGDFLTDSDWDKAPISAIEQVRIGNYDGEYVNGFWGLKIGDDKLTWQAGEEQRLRWKEENRWFELLESASSTAPNYLDKKALISLAADMVYQPNHEHNTKINLDLIPNIALAEKICRYDILEPGKWPEHMKLDSIRYDPQWKSITLSYGYRALRIVQTPVETALFTNLNSYKDVETVHIGDVTGQYGISPAEKTIWDSNTPPDYPVNNSYSVLLWQKDGMVYQIYFDQSFGSGGQLTKDQMIEIAESLH